MSKRVCARVRTACVAQCKTLVDKVPAPPSALKRRVLSLGLVYVAEHERTAHGQVALCRHCHPLPYPQAPLRLHQHV
jgi:hypothetical protein